MGNTGLRRTSSLQRFFPNFKHEDWAPVQANENTNRFGDLTTLRNKITKEEIDRYQLTFLSEREQRIYEQCFMQRLREDHLVNAFHYEQIKSNSICSGIKGAVAYIQHIPIRLSDITDIPFDESMYIMRCSLLGFEKLHNESGYFQVMEEHIGVDKEGHVKVWLNADLSKNYPYSFEEDTHQSKDYQKIMVSQIISLIEKNTNFEGGDQNEDSRYGYIPLSVFMQRTNRKHLSFRQAQQMIRQYCQKYSIQIPKRCSSVVEIFQQQYGEDFNITSASDFLDHLDVASTEGFQHYQRQTNERQHTMNMMSSRTKNEPRVHEGINKPSSRLGELHDNQGEASYKEYQPISIYKPNLKNSRASASAASSNRGRVGQNIKLKSHKSSIQASNHMNSNRNSVKNEKMMIKNQNINNERKQSGEQNSYNDGGLYANPSQLSSNFYNQIGNDLDRIYGEQLNFNRRSENENLKNSKAQNQNTNQYQNLQKSHASSSNHSNYGMKIINTSRSNEQRYVNNYNHMRNSNESMSNSSHSSRFIQNSNRPKITFTYQNNNNPSLQGSKAKPGINYTSLSDESYEHLERRIEEQVKRDIEVELKKGTLQQRETIKDTKKLPLYPTKINEEQNEDEVDPEILKDLIEQFPDQINFVY